MCGVKKLTVAFSGNCFEWSVSLKKKHHINVDLFCLPLFLALRIYIPGLILAVFYGERVNKINLRFQRNERNS